MAGYIILEVDRRVLDVIIGHLGSLLVLLRYFLGPLFEHEFTVLSFTKINEKPKNRFPLYVFTTTM